MLKKLAPDRSETSDNWLTVSVSSWIEVSLNLGVSSCVFVRASRSASGHFFTFWSSYCISGSRMATWTVRSTFFSILMSLSDLSAWRSMSSASERTVARSAISRHRYAIVALRNTYVRYSQLS